ncbi:DHHA1 domain-containing protein [Bacillus sp. FJAT-50051]|uniref:Alanine--tRNA ligase n=2 Tax=Neobacillus citreus TaxID=2833578 RepID=A0A942T1V2_9BACI|nr:DHHA1 domain-containing protein [Neobacillus citreus]MCH6268230.1 DHHA1 domain-containing protein [Neobacillus citreus]
MMENKLYYTDSYIKSFTAEVVKQEQDSSGNWFVVLSQTSFYPTGGGQPFDKGLIEGVKVVNVEEVDGEIRHYLEILLPLEKKEVCGELDWERRFDHMQQHAGQHILSAAFEHLFEYKTVGFHLGNETVTIDLDTEQLTVIEAEKAEELANQIILENRPIETKWVTEKELSQYPLRKETKVKEDIRLVIIPDFDYNGCGGTHPKGTGEVRAIKILDWERQKKKVRLQFVCGERVLKQFSQKQKVLLSLTNLLNTPEPEMEQAAIRLLEGRKAMEKELEQQQELLLKYEAKELLGKSSSAGVIGEVFQNRSIQELQKLARLVTGENDAVVVVLAAENEDRLQLVCARGASRTEKMNKLIQSGLEIINGKGGGNDSFAQGGGAPQVSSEVLLQHILDSLKVAST